ncbi:MAG: O-antigen ligase family protein [Bacillaceae bacterium]
MELITRKENTILIIAVYVQFVVWMFQFVVYAALGQGVILPVYYVCNTLRIFLLAICVCIWLKRSFIDISFVYVSVFVFFFIQVVVFRENATIVSEYYLFDFFVVCIPAFLNIKLINDEQLQIRIMVLFSWVVFLTGALYFLLYSELILHEDTYSMSYSYYMLFSSLTFLYVSFEKRRFLYIFPFIASMVLILIIGSRGAVISGIMYFLVIVFLSNKSRIARLFSLIIVIAFVANTRRIVEIIAKIFNEIGYDSRSIELLATGEFISYDSGRRGIYADAVELIRFHPFAGNGVGADIRMLGQYTHNFFLDVFVHFGIVLGGIIVILVVCLMIIAFINSKSKSLFFLYFFLGFFPLMVSGTYITSITFWMFLGYCISRINICILWRNKKKTEIDGVTQYEQNSQIIENYKTEYC